MITVKFFKRTPGSMTPLDSMTLPSAPRVGEYVALDDDDSDLGGYVHSVSYSFANPSKPEAIVLLK